MAQIFQNSFITAITPGAYPRYTVQNTTSGNASTGIVTVIGEADGGDSFSTEDLKANFFGPDQYDEVAAKYISGHIVDAFRALSASSNDTNITGSVNRIYIVKTNTGLKASTIIDTDYGDLDAKNFGILGNQTRYKVSASQLEVAPLITSTTIPAFGASLDSADFGVRLNGGASTTVTLSGTPANHSNVATLVIELNSLLPAGIVASAGVAVDTIVLTVAADSANYRKGWGKSVELIETTAADLAKFGLVAGQYNSSVESAVSTQISNASTGANETWITSGDVALEIGYQGTTATLTINATTLATTVVGGSGASLSITLADYATISDMATYINTLTGYSAAVVASATQLSPSSLDQVTAIGICSTGASLRAGRVKRSLFNYEASLSQSGSVDFVADEVEGLPSPMSGFVFLSGGTKGATTAANFISALDTLEGIQTNFVVPLFSQDASADITDNQTDSGSTYTIGAVHAATKSHCLEMSTPKMKRNRSAVLSLKGTFAEAQAQAQSLASFRCSMTFQDVFQINSQGVSTQFQPWYGACVAAGMQSAGFYKGITNKFANLISYVDPTGYDSGSPTDVDTMLLAGLLGLQLDTAGVRWVSDQTTYGFDSNFVYNSLQAVYAADIVALDLADSFQKQFVGQSLADVSAATGLAYLSTKMAQYYSLRLITGSDDAPAGFRNAKITINGPVMNVQVEIKLATSLYFIPIQISISQVQQSAG